MYSLAHARVNSQAKAFMSAWKAVIPNSFGMFLISDAVDKPLRPMANRFGGCFCLGSGPVLWCFCLFSAVCFAVSAGETQVWLGDLRVVVFGWLLWFFFCVVSIDLPPHRTLVVLVQMHFLLILI